MGCSGVYGIFSSLFPVLQALIASFAPTCFLCELCAAHQHCLHVVILRSLLAFLFPLDLATRYPSRNMLANVLQAVPRLDIDLMLP